MAELWLVLRGGLRILREKQKGLETAEEMTDSIVGTRSVGKLQPGKLRK